MLKYFRMKPAAYKNNTFRESDSGMAFTFAALIPYAAALVVTLLLGGTARIYGNLFVTQLSYLGIALWFGLRSKKGLSAFVVNKFEVKYLFLAIGLLYGMLFGLGYLNELFTDLIKAEGVSVPLDTPAQFVLTLVAVGILPGIMEEILFRGVILSGLSRIKTVYAVLLNGALFSLFHTNPAQTIYQFITGAVFALVVLRSGSIIPTIVMHLLNNLTVLFITYFAPEANVYNLYTIISGVLVFAACFIYLVFFDRKEAPAKENSQGLKYFFIYGGIGIAVCSALWVVSLFS